MKLRRVDFISQADAEAAVPNHRWAIISIRCPRDTVNLKDGWGAVLPLEFDDLDKFHSGYHLFEYSQADDIIDFVQAAIAHPTIDRLVIHCAAGISRSAAVALFVVEHMAKRLRLSRPTDAHNRLVRAMLEHQYHKRLEEQGMI